MIVFIEKNKTGTIDSKSEKIYSYWMIVKLKSGRQIEIQDLVPYNLNEYEGKNLDFLVVATFINNINSITERDEKDIAHPVIKGNYLGEYEIPAKWLNCNGYRMIPGYHAVKSIEGIFLIDPWDLKHQKVSLEIGEMIIFKAADIELKAWLPIEEEDEKTIDEQEKELTLNIESKDFIEKFWNLIDTIREKGNGDKWDRRQSFIEGLIEWTPDEMLLFDDTLSYLTSLLRENVELVYIFGYFSDDRWFDFCMGTVALGKNTYYEALNNPKKFYEDVMAGVHGEEPMNIESELYGVGDQTLEKAKGRPPHEFIDSVHSKVLDKIFEKIKVFINMEFL